jgi:hypothetical protein
MKPNQYYLRPLPLLISLIGSISKCGSFQTMEIKNAAHPIISFVFPALGNFTLRLFFWDLRNYSWVEICTAHNSPFRLAAALLNSTSRTKRGLLGGPTTSLQDFQANVNIAGSLAVFKIVTSSTTAKNRLFISQQIYIFLLAGFYLGPCGASTFALGWRTDCCSCQ